MKKYPVFEKLDEAKKLNIINAGFKVFGDYGYAKASVEEIIRGANISKGSLFYYFGSKKNFYLYLYEYCGEQLEKLVDSPGTDGQPYYMQYTDFFERLNAIQILKMKFSNDYPHITNFIKKMLFDPDPAVREEITKINDRYTKERAMLFMKGVDFGKFKDGIDPKMIITLLTWCSEGCANQVLLEQRMSPSPENYSPDFNRVREMYYKYVELFRNNFYKEEFLK